MNDGESVPDEPELPASVATGIQKAAAHSKVAHAVKTGALVREPCSYQISAVLATGPLMGVIPQFCGLEKTEAHHDDYARPLDVRWLCAVHHRAVHAAVKPPTSIRPGAMIAWRRLLDSGGRYPELAFVTVRRETTGIWIPAYLIDALDLPGGG